MEAQLDPIFQGMVDSGRIPGVAAVALDSSGKELFSKGYGYTTAGDTSSPKVTPSTPAMIWSCTKLITCVSALQLLEQGKFKLEDPVEKYLPQIKDIKVLKGFNEDGSPKLADPKSPVLILHLFTHTSGFAYDFFDQNTLQWRIAKEQPPCSYVTRSAMDEYTSPLIFEPGERWEYGPNQDWLGFLIEKISGLTLGEYVEKNIVKPLGLKNTGAELSPQQSKDFLAVHTKDAEGKLTATPMRMVENAPVPHPGGHYLYSSVDDYTQFLLAVLNGGTHPKSNATLLKPETNKLLFQDLLPKVGCSGKGVGTVPTTMPPVSSTGECLPGVDKGWSCGGLINNEAAPNGRSKGSLMWAGLGNCYFWVDPTAGVLGYVVSAILPFWDRDVLHLADALERAVYGKPAAKEIGEAGSNFSGGKQEAPSRPDSAVDV